MAVLFVSCGFAFGQDLNEGLVAYYPFNGNANDASGNNRHLSTQGQPTFEEGINGLLSAQFDDNADGFEITGQDTPSNTGAASVSVWFDQDDPSGSQVFVGLTRASTSRFIIMLEDGAISYQHGMERGGRLEAGVFENQPTLSNGWNNFVLTTSGNGGKVSGYLNGQFLGDVSAGINLTGLTDYMVGAYTELAPTDQYRQAFRGRIQNLRIYNRALSEQEITTLYGIESQNTQFQIIGGNFTWQEAKADAEAKGGRLAVLDTQAKIDHVRSFVRFDLTPYFWIGLTDEATEGDWRWINGMPLTASFWMDGEPNNLGNEDYVFYWGDRGWNDTLETTRLNFYLFEKTVNRCDDLEKTITTLVAQLAQKDAQIAELEKRPTKEVYDAVVAERNARPTKAAYDAVVVERDARFTQSDIQDARLGSVVLVPNIIEENEQIIQIRFRIEESNDLGIWESRQEVTEVNIPIKPGKKFYRFSVKED